MCFGYLNPDGFDREQAMEWDLASGNEAYEELPVESKDPVMDDEWATDCRDWTSGMEQEMGAYEALPVESKDPVTDGEWATDCRDWTSGMEQEMESDLASGNEAYEELPVESTILPTSDSETIPISTNFLCRVSTGYRLGNDHISH